MTLLQLLDFGERFHVNFRFEMESDISIAYWHRCVCGCVCVKQKLEHAFRIIVLAITVQADQPTLFG
jgi:hypothetical protein